MFHGMLRKYWIGIGLAAAALLVAGSAAAGLLDCVTVLSQRLCGV